MVHKIMKINPRYYPVILLITFVLFVLLGILLGFRPQHGNGNHESYMLMFTQYAINGLGAIV